MIGTGTIANVAAIVLGGAIGLGVRGGLKAHYQEGLMKAWLWGPWWGSSSTSTGRWSAWASG